MLQHHDVVVKKFYVLLYSGDIGTIEIAFFCYRLQRQLNNLARVFTTAFQTKKRSRNVCTHKRIFVTLTKYLVEKYINLDKNFGDSKRFFFNEKI